MSNFIEGFRGVVYPWHCDHLGHMNVQHYVGMFDQATFHLLSIGGFRWADGTAATHAFVDVKHEVSYMAEQPVGSLIVVESGILRIGNSSMAQFHRMKNFETGVTAATSEIVCVYFDLEARKSMPIPDALRETLGKLMVEKDT